MSRIRREDRPINKIVLILIVLLFAISCTPPEPEAESEAESGEAPRPNIIVINLDDARVATVDQMTVVNSRLIDEGISFEHAFTPNAVCAPSRASLLSGLYALNHKTFNVFGPVGGERRFRESGADQETIAVWLQDAGYRTGLFGKYLNLYTEDAENPDDPGMERVVYIPPGWDRWWAMLHPESFGGIHGSRYEVIEEDGTRTVYDDHTTDAEYSTDLSARKLRDFMAEVVARGQPFFIYWNPFAPHIGKDWLPVPADRHIGNFANLAAWRPASFNELDVSDKPRWVQALVQQTSFDYSDSVRIRGYESLLSVDEQIGNILDDLDLLGIDRDTAIIFTSDHGASWGEHRWFGGLKECPYEECQRVPFVVRYPRHIELGAVVSDTIALNIDIAPTIAALARVEVPVPIDGVSLEDWLLGKCDAQPRTDYLLEHWRKNRNDSIEFSANPRDGDQLRLYYGDSSLSPRPSALFEFEDCCSGVSEGAVEVPIMSLPNSTLGQLSIAVESAVPDVTPVFLTANRFAVVDMSPESYGVTWWEEVDQNDAVTTNEPMPDYFGVRDVAEGYTWVQFGNGERELYDLRIDPHQLDNVADDSRYSAVRARLEARFLELRDQASIF